MHTRDILKYGHLWVLKHLEGLTEAEWEEPGVCGVWSVKEIIAHLASFERMLVDLLGELSGQAGPFPTLDQYRRLDGDRFNAVQVGQRKGASPAEVRGEYEQAQAEVMACLEALPEPVLAQTGALPWYGREYDLEDFIVYSFYGHKREHCAQIAVYRDRLGK